MIVFSAGRVEVVPAARVEVKTKTAQSSPLEIVTSSLAQTFNIIFIVSTVVVENANTVIIPRAL